VLLEASGEAAAAEGLISVLLHQLGTHVASSAALRAGGGAGGGTAEEEEMDEEAAACVGSLPAIQPFTAARDFWDSAPEVGVGEGEGGKRGGKGKGGGKGGGSAGQGVGDGMAVAVITKEQRRVVLKDAYDLCGMCQNVCRNVCGYAT